MIPNRKRTEKKNHYSFITIFHDTIKSVSTNATRTIMFGIYRGRFRNCRGRIVRKKALNLQKLILFVLFIFRKMNTLFNDFFLYLHENFKFDTE